MKQSSDNVEKGASGSAKQTNGLECRDPTQQFLIVILSVRLRASIDLDKSHDNHQLKPLRGVHYQKVRVGRHEKKRGETHLKLTRSTYCESNKPGRVDQRQQQQQHWPLVPSSIPDRPCGGFRAPSPAREVAGGRVLTQLTGPPAPLNCFG